MKKTPSDTGVLAAILQFNQDRKPGLLRLKLRKMRADPFTFFRGADHLFCRDWPELRPLDAGPDVLISGDLHLENFGAHRTTEGDFRYDLNDFDEAVVAPCSFDVVRCATSIILASEQWKLRPSQATGMALAYLENYRKAVLKAVESGSVHEIVPHGGHGPIQEILGSTAIATQAQLLKAKTRRKADGRPLIRRTDTAVNVSRKWFDEVAAALESHGQRLGKPDAFKVHDLVFRIVGVGSLGVRRYLALVEGAGPPDGYQLLDIKEPRPSAAAPCATDTLVDIEGDEARRVVLSQTILQGHVAVGLDVLKIGQRPYRMREMIPVENRSSLDRFRQQPERLRRAVERAGRLTASSQLRGARFKPDHDRWPDLARWAEGPSLDAVLAAAARFTERTNRQHAEFQAATRDAGGISAALHAFAGQNLK
ncbi:MAG: DUF2252 family protein [Isosphaeraceae bacterium]|jgi:uncharacterized protein (DUF2252 family)